jgi:lipopolysaccharide/colanic/teichoic acid biosynthesis glycosyltransferase
LSAKPYFLDTSEGRKTRDSQQQFDSREKAKKCRPVLIARRSSDMSLFLVAPQQLSPWSRSSAKRIFDCLCVGLTMPLLLPVILTVALAVRLTSAGPVLFLQKRIGRHGREFTILKFRTMIHSSDNAHRPVTTAGNQSFTPIGPFLRRWKLDELPQLFNVLAGQMSLVGPRPKLPQHAITHLSCRVGITGAATIAFAREEAVLDRVPQHHLQSFYHLAVLPAKHEIDTEYMANATFLSDLKLIVDSILRRWDVSLMERLLSKWAFEFGANPHISELNGNVPFSHGPMLPRMNRSTSAGEARAV